MTTLDFEANVVTEEKERKGGLTRVATFCLFALMFLLPIFFVPGLSFPFQFSKAILLSVLMLVAFCLWIVARLKDGRFAIPSSPIIIALFSILGIFVISGLLSGSVITSLFGQGFEVGTTLSILIAVLLASLVPVMLRSKEQIFKSYIIFLVSFAFISIFHILRLAFGPGFLSLGLFTDAVSNTIGRWNDLGVFFGVSAILSLVTVESIKLIRVFKGLVYLVLIISLFFIALINFSTLWFVLGLLSLVFLVYRISFRASSASIGTLLEEENAEAPQSAHSSYRLPIPSLVVLLISTIFFLAGNTIGSQLGSVFNISQSEARPSWGATIGVARHTLVADPLFGAGPNRFVSEWLKYKPAGVNETVFWNSDFNYGVGLVPTFLATTGIFGILAWVAFFLTFLYAGFKAILSNTAERFSEYLITSSFFVASFLWIFTVFYTPSPTIFTLTFLFTGLFISALTIEKMAPTKVISFVNNPRAGFVSVLLLILLLIGGVTLGYFLVQKYVASVFFQKGVMAYNAEGNIDKAEQQIAKAATMSPMDLYYRFLTELTLMRMNALLSQNQNAASAESVRASFQNFLGTALGHARQAVGLNPTSYENEMELGRVYEAVVPLGIQGAYESAKTAYDQALTLNPHSPAIYLTMARLEVAKKDNMKARENIKQALQEKSNYTDAIFLLSQIEAAEGNIKAAISSVEAASTIAPDDSSIFFQLGLLRFNDKDYKGAASALERAVGQNPVYANAKYFLGLSYDKLKRQADAIKQFTELVATNPDNKEIKLILSNLKAGKDPFVDATPPVDATPEKRKKLPVDEKASKNAPVTTEE